MQKVRKFGRTVIQRNVTRVGNGWQVKPNGNTESKYFSDVNFKGPLKALKAANFWIQSIRDPMLKFKLTIEGILANERRI